MHLVVGTTTGILNIYLYPPAALIEIRSFVLCSMVENKSSPFVNLQVLGYTNSRGCMGNEMELEGKEEERE